MILCSHCGVEVEDGLQRCPLCRRSLEPGLDHEESPPAPPRRDVQATNRRLHRWLLEVVSLFALTSILVVFAADLATGFDITWSRYPLTSIGFTWLSAVLLILWVHRTWIFLPAEIVTTGLFLFILDRFTPGTTWFLPLAFPLTVLIGTALALTLVVVRKRRLSPFANIATVLLACGVFVMGLELLLNRYADGLWQLSWSAVVFASLLPIVALLLYLRRWLGQRQQELRKLLHL
jgi:hypothetical protein